MHAYIDAHSKRLIDEYPGYAAQSISILQSQCANATFADRSIYSRLIQQVIHKGGESEISYIKLFQNAKALEISVGNSYFEDKLMHTLSDNFQQDAE